MVIIRNVPNTHTFHFSNGDSLRLLPGSNTVTKEHAVLLKKEYGEKSSAFMRQVAAKILTVKDVGDSEDVVSAVVECKNIPEAREIVKNIFDIKQLNELAKQEKRKAVLSFVNAQIKQVEEKLSNPGVIQNPNGGSSNFEDLGDHE